MANEDAEDKTWDTGRKTWKLKRQMADFSIAWLMNQINNIQRTIH